MSKTRNLIKLGLLSVVLFTGAYSILAGETVKETPSSLVQSSSKKFQEPPPSNQQSVPKEGKDSSISIRETALGEAQRCFDRSLTILNIVVTGIGVLAAGLAILTALGIGIGIFEYRKWLEIRENAEKEQKEAEQALKRVEKTATVIEGIRGRMEECLNKAREDTEGLPTPSGDEKPSNELQEKIDYFNRRLELLEMFGLPLTSSDYLKRGVHFFYRNEYEAALTATNKALELDPNNASAWASKAAALDNLARLEEALVAIDKALKLEPNNTKINSNKAGILLNFDRPKEALALAEKVLKIDLSNVSALTTKSGALSRLNLPEEALIICEKALELDPDRNTTWVNKSFILTKLNRLDEAIEAAIKAIEIDKSRFKGSYNLACAYALKGEKGRSLKALRKAIELYPACIKHAKKDEDFRSLWEDEDFMKLVSQDI